MSDGSKSVPELPENTNPQGIDLFYLAKAGSLGSYSDKKSNLENIKKYVKVSKTVIKSGSYTISINQCDKRWYSNRDATSSIIFVLPKSEDGKEVGILLEENKTVRITPNPLDIISPISTTIGQSIQCNIRGNNVYLRGYPDGWAIVSQEGTWNISS